MIIGGSWHAELRRSAGETQTISVTVNGDTKLETDETFTVDLSNPTNSVTISDAQGVGTLTNDDAASYSIDDVTAAETNSGTTTFTFTVTLDEAVAGGSSVDYTTTDGSATTADSDYVAASGTLNFAGTAGETQQSVSRSMATASWSRMRRLRSISNPSNAVTISDAQGVGTLTNDDAASYSIDDVAQTETDSRHDDVHVHCDPQRDSSGWVECRLHDERRHGDGRQQ